MGDWCRPPFASIKSEFIQVMSAKGRRGRRHRGVANSPQDQGLSTPNQPPEKLSDSKLELISKLTEEEHQQLEQCESIIHSGLLTFFDVGQALLAIRDNHLYRANHHSFEQYCRER